MQVEVFDDTDRRPYDMATIYPIPGSSNGRTTAFEAVYLGPNPSPGATKKTMPKHGLFLLC